MGRKKKIIKKASPPKVSNDELASAAKSTQHLFGKDKVETMKLQGWKEVKNADLRMQKNIDRNEGDLVLMER